jgi:NTE family protein
MPMPAVRVTITALLAALAAAQQPAQQPAQQHGPPRTGLVLSGGGARGAARVGGLKVLEELRVPVHCIAGTSMGAIVGGMYAYGLSPEQLEQLLVRSGPRDWSYLLADGPPRPQWTWRRKEDSRGFYSELVFGIRDGALRLPKGLLRGQNLEFELGLVALQAHDLPSFDMLPIPFRCVAVDIGTGSKVVLDRGSLPAAVRASMSLPGVFDPAVVDGHELLDGGLVENVPVEEARAMAAERLIVVDIGTPPATAAEIQNLLAVTGQMVSLLMQQNVDRSLASLTDLDLLIQPDLGSITSADFERSAEAIAIGEAAARAVADRLRAYAVSEAEYQEFQRRQRRPVTPPRIRRFRLDNKSQLDDAVLQSRLEVQAGQPFDAAALQADIDRLFAMQDFDSVAFTVTDWRDGEADLTLTASERSWGVSTLRFALQLESSSTGDSQFNLSSQLTLRPMDSLGAEWRTEARLGQELGLLSEYYQPLLAGGPWFVAPRVLLDSRPITAFQNGVQVAELDARRGAVGLDLGAVLWDWGELRAGIERSAGDVDVDLTSIPGLQDFRFDDAAGRVQVVADTILDTHFPKSGTLAVAAWRSSIPDLGADSSYQQLTLGLLQPVTFGAWTWQLQARTSLAIEGTVPFEQQPAIGGFWNLSGLPTRSIFDQNVGLLALIQYYKLSGKDGPLGMPVYVGGSIEAGNAWTDIDDAFGTFVIAGSVFVGLDTPAGPLYLAGGFAEGGDRALYVFLGPIF